MDESQLMQTCHMGMCSALSRCVCAWNGVNWNKRLKKIETLKGKIYPSEYRVPKNSITLPTS